MRGRLGRDFSPAPEHLCSCTIVYVKKILIALVLVGGAFSGCSPAPTPIAPSSTPTPQPIAVETEIPTPEPTLDSRVQIRFWHAQSQSAIAPLIDKFNSINSDVLVVATAQNSNIDLINQLVASLNSNAQPDVLVAYPPDLAQFARSGALVPLDDPKLGFSADDLKDFFPAFVDRYPQFGNKLYSLGLYRHLQVMYYNADLLKGSNAKLPENWDDFIKACAAVTKPPDVVCFEMDPNAMDFESSVLGRAGGLLTGDAKRVTFDQRQGLDTLTFVGDLFKNKYAVLTTRAFQEQSDFAASKVAFTFDTTLALPSYDRQIKNAGKNFVWGIALQPRTAAPMVMAYGPSLAIVNGSQEKQQAAFTFVKWMLSKESNSTFALATNSFPARQSAKDNLADFIKGNAMYSQAFNWLRFARTEPNVAAWASVRAIIADAMLSVATGKAQPADALKDAAAKANGALGQ